MRLPRAVHRIDGHESSSAHGIGSPPDAGSFGLGAFLPHAVAWRWYAFGDLDVALLYSALKLRQDIFIVEQNVPYADIDEKDRICQHLLGISAGAVVAYLRVLPHGLFKPGAVSLGRVTVRADLRHLGLGRELVARGLAHLDATRGATPVAISSQLYLKPFYERFGFQAEGASYIEDQIPHIAMTRG